MIRFEICSADFALIRIKIDRISLNFGLNFHRRGLVRKQITEQNVTDRNFSNPELAPGSYFTIISACFYQNSSYLTKILVILTRKKWLICPNQNSARFN